MSADAVPVERLLRLTRLTWELLRQHQRRLRFTARVPLRSRAEAAPWVAKHAAYVSPDDADAVKAAVEAKFAQWTGGWEVWLAREEPTLESTSFDASFGPVEPGPLVRRLNFAKSCGTLSDALALAVEAAMRTAGGATLRGTRVLRVGVVVGTIDVSGVEGATNVFYAYTHNGKLVVNTLNSVHTASHSGVVVETADGQVHYIDPSVEQFVGGNEDLCVIPVPAAVWLQGAGHVRADLPWGVFTFGEVISPDEPRFAWGTVAVQTLMQAMCGMMSARTESWHAAVLPELTRRIV
jgi:hypothetical protein